MAPNINKNMDIIKEYPPVFNKILDSGMRPSPYTVYAYGDKIYNPSGMNLPEEILVHEEVHMRQQMEYIVVTPKQNPVESWWERFIEDKYFRIAQEVEAYAVQYRFVCKRQKDRNIRNKVVLHYAKTLAGPIYGNCVSVMGARKMILDKANI